MTSDERTKQRVVICVNFGKTPAETLDMMHIKSKGYLVCNSLNYKWHRRYSDELVTVKDGTRSGSLVTDMTSTDILAAKLAMDSYRRSTLKDVLCLLFFKKRYM